MTSFHAIERATIDARLIAIATATQAQRTPWKAAPTPFQLGPNQRATKTPANTPSASESRTQRLCASERASSLTP